MKVGIGRYIYEKYFFFSPQAIKNLKKANKSTSSNGKYFAAYLCTYVQRVL